MSDQSIHSLPASAVEIPAPQNRDERMELANELYRRFHTICFWHCPHDLDITEDLIPFVVKGLRTHGGHAGFMLAGKLQPNPADRAGADRELRECR